MYKCLWVYSLVLCSVLMGMFLHVSRKCLELLNWSLHHQYDERGAMLLNCWCNFFSLAEAKYISAERRKAFKTWCFVLIHLLKETECKFQWCDFQFWTKQISSDHIFVKCSPSTTLTSVQQNSLRGSARFNSQFKYFPSLMWVQDFYKSRPPRFKTTLKRSGSGT